MRIHVPRPPTQPEKSRNDAREVAATAMSGPSIRLPYADAIQRAFGRHDVSDARAHMGPAASAAARALSAHAFTTGTDVVFGGRPNLQTAAHEAAHVVQQRAGVSLPGGLDGGDGDPLERHADQVAALVVQGRSAERVLNGHVGDGSEGPALQRRRIVIFSRHSVVGIDTENLSRERLEELLESESLSQENKLEIMRAIDAGEVEGGYPGAYEYAEGHLTFLHENLPPFGEENDFTWLRRIPGGGAGTLTGKRDDKGIKTDMSEQEYEDTAELTRGFHDTAALLNTEQPRQNWLTLYRGFTVPASKDKDAADKLAEGIADFSDVLPSSASWQREQAIKMSNPGLDESAVLLYMAIPPTHPIVIMSYPSNTNPDNKPKALDLQQAEVLVAASTFEDVNVFRIERLSDGRLRYHVSVTLVPRDHETVMNGIQEVRETAAEKRKSEPKAETKTFESDQLAGIFGEDTAKLLQTTPVEQQVYTALDGQQWRFGGGDDFFGYAFTRM